MRPVFIGVDPAFRKDGFAACVIDQTDKTARFLNFQDVLRWSEWLHSDDAPEHAIVCIENSNLQDITFDMRGNRSEIARKSRNVGCNQAVSQLAFVAAVRRYGPGWVFEISPKDKGHKYTPSEFLSVVRQDGIKLPGGSINQDHRDAYKLANIARMKSRVATK